MALGLPALRERIARHYAERYGVTVARDQVVVTTGSSAGFVLAFLSLFDVGQKVALPSPGYPCYRHILTALGQEPVLMTTDQAGRWMPTAADIEAAAAHGLAGLVLASPANPTGTMLQPGRLAELAAARFLTYCLVAVRWLPMPQQVLPQAAWTLARSFRMSRAAASAVRCSPSWSLSLRAR